MASACFVNVYMFGGAVLPVAETIKQQYQLNIRTAAVSIIVDVLQCGTRVKLIVADFPTDANCCLLVAPTHGRWEVEFKVQKLLYLNIL